MTPKELADLGFGLARYYDGQQTLAPYVYFKDPSYQGFDLQANDFRRKSNEILQLLEDPQIQKKTETCPLFGTSGLIWKADVDSETKFSKLHEAFVDIARSSESWETYFAANPDKFLYFFELLEASEREKFAKLGFDKKKDAPEELSQSRLKSTPEIEVTTEKVPQKEESFSTQPPNQKADSIIGIKAGLEGKPTYKTLVIIAETLAEVGYEMTFCFRNRELPSNIECETIIFEPSREALLRGTWLDESKPLRQIYYKFGAPINWSGLSDYFGFLLNKLFKEDESNTITEKLINRIFDFALLNFSEEDLINSLLFALVDEVGIDIKNQSKYEYYTAKYAAQIKEVILKIREVKPYIESFPLFNSSENLNSQLMSWFKSPDIWKNTNLTISPYGSGYISECSLNDETIDALLASSKRDAIKRLTLTGIYLSQQSLEKILTLPNLAYLEIAGISYPGDWNGSGAEICPTLSPKDIEFLKMHQLANNKLTISLYNQD